MYDVMIVDDEAMVREGLKALISWEEYGFRVIDTARNGKEGFTKYRQLSPDLMIVDIRMPEVDGLSLIESIRAEDSAIHFIILSGHSDFNYAKKALGCQCDDYLLKPLDEDELIDSLKKVYGRITRHHQVHELVERAQEKQVEMVLTELLEGTPLSEIPIGKEHNFFATDYQVALVENRQDRLTKQLKRLIEEQDEGYVIPFPEYIVIVCKNRFLQKRGKDHRYHLFAKWLEEEELHACAGSKVVNLVDIHESYQSAKRLYEKKFFVEKGRLFTADQLVDRSKPEAPEFSLESYADRLYYSIDIGNMQGCVAIIEELKNVVIVHLQEEKEIKVALFQLYSNILHQLVRSHPNMEGVLEPLVMNAGDIYQFEHLPGIMAFLTKQLKHLIECLDNGQPDLLLRKMIALIHKDYAKNLRLETLASVFNYNRAYLGKLFKNYTGEYFNTYLDKVRIENGKRLLQKGYKVYEVAEKIGYANVDYFHRKFKKYVGVSPSTFRKRHDSLQVYHD